MKTEGIVMTVTPMTGMKGDGKKAKLIDYERVDLAFTGDVTGYAVINNFEVGTLKAGDKIEMFKKEVDRE